MDYPSNISEQKKNQKKKPNQSTSSDGKCSKMAQDFSIDQINYKIIYVRNAAHVQNLPRKSRVIFTSFGGFIFTCYFFHELETSIVPSTLSYWLYRPGIRTAGETIEKEQIPTSAGRAHSHVPSSSLSQSNLTLKGWPEWWEWDRWAGEGTWDVHRWSTMVSWTHCCCC